MVSTSYIARILIILGLLFLLIGGSLIVLDKLGITKGKIPGDIRFEWGSFTCVIALGTSLIISFLLTIGLNILIRLLNR